MFPIKLAHTGRFCCLLSHPHIASETISRSFLRDGRVLRELGDKVFHALLFSGMPDLF